MDDRVLDSALQVALAHRAHVEALYVRVDPRDILPALGEGASAALIETVYASVERDATARYEAAKRRFEQWLQRQGVRVAGAPDASDEASIAFREATGDEYALTAAAGRLADLIVIGRPESREDTGAINAIESALTATGRPVLVVPPSAVGPTAQRVVIAWNGSKEASRAVGYAMPLLANTGEVAIFAVGEKGASPADPAELIRYLAWHRIGARALPPATAGSAATGALLMKVAAEQSAGLVVMGAYTHSRLRQLVFGGVTNHMLWHTEIPVLLAH
jgi:nucleotide-binding universal stress UspA family protein